MGARLDQHFLKDEAVRDEIVAAAEIRPSETVVEIGPGKGILTGAVLAKGARVIAVEMDDRLPDELRLRFEGESLEIIHADFLALDLDRLGPGPVKFVANLPYSVAAPILQRILAWPRWSSAVLMFQKEVAERIVAAPGGADYGILTLSVAARAEAEMVLEVPRECFAPRPKVASAVVRLVRREAPLISGEAEGRFFTVVKAAFGQRRKMAAGPISARLGLPRAKVESALARCGVDPQARAERIPLEAYLRLPAELGL